MSDADDERQRYAIRIESFSDIVFGFALAQCAVSLELPRSLAEAGKLAPHLFVFVVTFSLVAMFWALHYRMFRWLFAGRTFDVILNFALLADIALLPFALQLFFRFNGNLLAYSVYAAVLGVAFLLLAALEYRGFRCYDATLEAARRTPLWRAVIRHGISGTIMLLSLPLVTVVGAAANALWLVVPIGGALLPRLFHAPARAAREPAAA